MKFYYPIKTIRSNLKKFIPFPTLLTGFNYTQIKREKPMQRAIGLANDLTSEAIVTKARGEKNVEKEQVSLRA